MNDCSTVSGKFTSLCKLNQREQSKFFSSNLFSLTGEDWMAEPGAVEWTEGKGLRTKFSHDSSDILRCFYQQLLKLHPLGKLGGSTATCVGYSRSRSEVFIVKAPESSGKDRGSP